MPGYVEDRNKNEILTALVDTAEPGSRAHEQQKMGIIVRCTEDVEKALGGLEKSMNDNARASDKLANRKLENRDRHYYRDDSWCSL